MPTIFVLQRLARAMRALRPVVETGYENILLARMCIEQVGALQSEQIITHTRIVLGGDCIEHALFVRGVGSLISKLSFNAFFH